MATTYVDNHLIAHLASNTSIKEYVTMTADVSRSNNTVTMSNINITLSVRAISVYGESQNYYITNGQYDTTVVAQTGTFGMDWSQSSLPHYMYLTIPNFSFTVNPTQTSKTFWLRASANEESAKSFTLTFQGWTAPATPTVSGVADSSTQITITYGTTSFGNPSTGVVSLYGGDSANPTTVIDTYNQLNDTTFVFTNLQPNTTYYFRAKANNGQLSSDYSTEISITTPASSPRVKLYGSVNDQSKLVRKFYGPVNGQTKRVMKIYGSVNGKTKLIYEDYN